MVKNQKRSTPPSVARSKYSDRPCRLLDILEQEGGTVSLKILSAVTSLPSSEIGPNLTPVRCLT